MLGHGAGGGPAGIDARDARERTRRGRALAAEALDGLRRAVRPHQGPGRPGPRRPGRGQARRDRADRRGLLRARCCPRSTRRRTIVAVTADHSTSCVRKAHTADPVPLVVAGGAVRPDGSTPFGERACAEGSLGLLRGVEILPRLVDLLRG